MALRPIEAIITDERLAAFLISNPIKNSSNLFMWLKHKELRCMWMIVDGAFLRGNENNPPPKVD